MDAPVRCILFDVGGVLVELSGMHTLMRWMRRPTDIEGLWRMWLTSPVVRDFERGRIDAPRFAAGLVAEFDLEIDIEQLLPSFIEWPRGPIDGAYALLTGIRPGIVRATLSNSNALHWPRFLHKMDFGRHFDHHFASHLMDRIKPDHDAFDHVANTLGLEPGAILFVDDNQINVDAARGFGMQAQRCVGPLEVRAVLAARGLLV
ncbi:MAG TPA: HAD-IA family hydrolase [Pseudomonadales bacterium]